jgi:hypothetical protein
MTSIKEFFAWMGLVGEQRIDQLTERAEALARRREGHRRLEGEVRRLASDGVITPQEAEELAVALRAGGIDPGEIQEVFAKLRGSDGVLRGDGLGRFEAAAADLLGKEGAAIGDQLVEIRAQAQEAQLYADTGFATASSANKAEHETYLTIIRNLAA